MMTTDIDKRTQNTGKNCQEASKQVQDMMNAVSVGGR